MDCLLNSTEIPKSSLPKLRVGEGTPRPTLSTLHIGLPNLSLQDDGIIYFLAKIDFRDNTHIAWMLAVDMTKKTVQKVCEFSAMRTAGLFSLLGSSCRPLSNKIGFTSIGVS